MAPVQKDIRRWRVLLAAVSLETMDGDGRHVGRRAWDSFLCVAARFVDRKDSRVFVAGVEDETRDQVGNEGGRRNAR